MMGTEERKVRPGDRTILRELCKQRLELVYSELNQKRRGMWTDVNDLKPGTPPVLIETHVAFDDLFDASELKCAEEWARGMERGLRHDLWVHSAIQHDTVLEPDVAVGWRVSNTGYGVEIPKTHGDTGHGSGSYTWDHPIKDLQKDLGKLKPREFTVDRESSLANKAFMEELFGDLVPVTMAGKLGWTFGLTWSAIELIGLENLMLFMYDDPTGLHELMTFLRDDHLAWASWTEAQGLLQPNCAGHIGSGGMGYTSELPSAGYVAGSPATTRDRWVLLESQETVGVSPELFAEFIFPYHQSLAEHFGMVYYGCCEPLDDRWPVVSRLENLRVVSVSPWSNQAEMAGKLGSAYVFARKPNPAMISTDVFDEDAIRADIQETLSVAGNQPMFMIMKDLHTLNGEPERAARWVAIAHEEIVNAGLA